MPEFKANPDEAKDETKDESPSRWSSCVFYSNNQQNKR